MLVKQFKWSKGKKGELLVMLAAILGTSLLGNILPGKRVAWTGEGAIRKGQDFKCYLIL